MTQLTHNVFAVELPEDARNIAVHNYFLEHQLNLMYVSNIDPLSWQDNAIILPPGTYVFLFTTKNVTEEQAASVVDGRKNAYRDYEREFNSIPLCVFTSIESLDSLLRSKNLDPKKNWAVIQKI